MQPGQQAQSRMGVVKTLMETARQTGGVILESIKFRDYLGRQLRIGVKKKQEFATCLSRSRIHLFTTAPGRSHELDEGIFSGNSRGRIGTLTVYEDRLKRTLLTLKAFQGPWKTRSFVVNRNDN
jgi:hypothetical protein